MKHLRITTLASAAWLALALGFGDGATSQDPDDTDSGNNTTPGGSNNNNDTEGSNNGGNGRTGTTECGVQTCSAGQYCDNLICSDGCLSDDNCTSTQVCEKEAGENRGTCQTTAPAPSAKDCPGFVQKCVACGQPEVLCQMECDVVNAECTSCVINNSGCFLEACDAPCGR